MLSNKSFVKKLIYFDVYNENKFPLLTSLIFIRKILCIDKSKGFIRYYALINREDLFDNLAKTKPVQYNTI